MSVGTIGHVADEMCSTPLREPLAEDRHAIEGVCKIKSIHPSLECEALRELQFERVESWARMRLMKQRSRHQDAELGVSGCGPVVGPCERAPQRQPSLHKLLVYAA